MGIKKAIVEDAHIVEGQETGVLQLTEGSGLEEKVPSGIIFEVFLELNKCDRSFNAKVDREERSGLRIFPKFFLEQVLMFFLLQVRSIWRSAL
jgi:hypothetical protein